MSAKGDYHIPGNRVPLCHFSPGFLPDLASLPGPRLQIEDGVLEKMGLIVRFDHPQKQFLYLLLFR
jgi:hypothetical protein